MKEKTLEIKKGVMSRIQVVLFVFVFIFVWSQVAFSAPKRKTKKKIVLKELVIRGKIQKPEAMIILQRSTSSRILKEQLSGSSFVERVVNTIMDKNLN